MDFLKNLATDDPYLREVRKRAMLMRDTVEIIAVEGVKPRPRGSESDLATGFVQAGRGYYEALADAFLRWAQECPEHAVKHIANTLEEVEELAWMHNAGNRLRPVPGNPSDQEIHRLREQNDRRLGFR